MPLWKLVPTTHETDPRWMGRSRFDEVIVRADTAGMARLVAARLEVPGGPANPQAVGNGTEPLGSALEDEKLYGMAMLSDQAARAAGLVVESNEGGDGGQRVGVVHAVPSPPHNPFPSGTGPTSA